MMYSILDRDGVTVEAWPINGSITFHISLVDSEGVRVTRQEYLEVEEFDALRRAVKESDAQYLQQLRESNSIALLTPGEASSKDLYEEHLQARKDAPERLLAVIERLEGGVL